VRHVVITSLAVITPTGAILFLPIPIAAFAGKAMPLAIIVAFVVVLVVMNAIYRFSQQIAHAGSFYAFVRAALGVEAGFFTGWLFLAFYPVLTGLDMILFGATLHSIIVSHGGPSIPWWLLMVVGLVVIWLIGVIGIRFSARSDFVLLVFEIGVLLALAITILVTGAPGGDWHAQVFNPQSAPGGFGGVAVGAVFGVLAFTGFEASAYLGEEVQNPRRSIPKAMLITVIVTGIIYVFFFYITTVGFGLNNVGKIPANAAPWDTLGLRYWGSGATVLIDIASVVALIAGGLAAQNGAARMTMALGREGLLPPALGRTSSRFGTPGYALTLLLGVSVALGLGFGVGFQPLPAFSLLSLVVTLCALGVYMFTQVGLIRYFWKRGTLNVFWHLILPAAAIAAMIYLYYKSLVPSPAYPNNWGIWIALIWAGLGLLVLLWLKTKNPRLLTDAAEIIGGADGPIERGLLEAEVSGEVR
jgi:amino acid transporter